jgi:hypothetical protein
MTEYFREGSENIPFCALHSGGISGDDLLGNSLDSMPSINALPVRPKEPFLVGEDPYHTLQPIYSTPTENDGLVRRSTNVLDSLDLVEIEEEIRLSRPPRLEINPE